MNKSQIIVSKRGNQCCVNADIMVFKVTKCGCLAGKGHMLETQSILGLNCLYASRLQCDTHFSVHPLNYDIES